MSEKQKLIDHLRQQIKIKQDKAKDACYRTFEEFGDIDLCDIAGFSGMSGGVPFKAVSAYVDTQIKVQVAKGGFLSLGERHRGH